MKMETWRAAVEHLPFIVGAAGPSGMNVNTTRIAEALLIAALTAFASSAMTADKVSIRLEERIAAMTVRVSTVESVIEQQRIELQNARERIAVTETKCKH